MAKSGNGSAIVTGSSSGIGKAIAKNFAENGINTVINSRSYNRAKAVADEISPTNGLVEPVEADVSKRHDVQKLVDTAVSKFGSLDIMVNNAASSIISPSEEITQNEWQDVIDVTLTGTFFGCQAAGDHMIDQGTGGSIVNITSILGERGLEKRAPYTAAKSGVTNLTRTLAVEWAKHGIHVNALAPGYINTELSQDLREQESISVDDIEQRTPLNRLGTVEEIAKCVNFLALVDNYITGEILHADGGCLAWHRSD